MTTKTLLADADEYVRKHTGANGLPFKEEGAHLVLDLAAELRGRERELDELRSAAREVLDPKPIYTLDLSEWDAIEEGREKAMTRLRSLVGVEDTTEATP